ncbi:NlpC/P60 family protein [Micromonospora zamorensis]|uniref:C40 family peptidase n=1 Tax=Micromonospora zamorensis TaxID=709883 RepID=UPI003CE6EF42
MNRLMVGAVMVALISVAGGVSVAVPARAEPSAAEIERQLDAAWEKLEPVIEQYNGIHAELQSNKAKSAALQKKIAPLQQQVELSQGQVNGLAARQYRLGPASYINAVLATGDPQSMSDRLAMLDYVARSNNRAIAGVVAARDDLVRQRASVEALVAKQKRLDAELAGRRKVIQAEVDRLETLRTRSGGGSSASTALLRIGSCPAVNPGGAAGTAVKVACAQIGKPYVWGSDGPDSFDCSGLTQYAWKAAGVSLTHFTGAQWRQGAPVSRADLRSGDLVFFYSDLHHVGMYVGNGLIVHASRAGVPVKMARLDTMPYMGARRP